MCIRDRAFSALQFILSASRQDYASGTELLARAALAFIGVVAMLAWLQPVSYTHLRAHETVLDLVCRLLLEKKQTTQQHTHNNITQKDSTQIHNKYDV